MNAQRTYKRSLLNLSVKREMQFQMIGKICLLIFISLLISSLIFYVFADREITSSYQMFHIKARNFLDFLLPAVLGAFALSLVLGVIGSLFFPKPIAGGIYRIEQDVQKVISQGDLTVEIKLRQGDQVISLANEVNNLLGDYRGRMARIDASLQEMEQNVEDDAVVRGARDKMRAELQALQF
jgi:methyl-accepting chemotaxis protein